jgi:hypothetical protein
MKKFTTILLLMFAVTVFTSCADSQTFQKSDGTEFTVEPYGWMNNNQVEGVTYQVCKGNIVLDVIFSETLIAPILLTGLQLWEPVSYQEPLITDVTDSITQDTNTILQQNAAIIVN